MSNGLLHHAAFDATSRVCKLQDMSNNTLCEFTMPPSTDDVNKPIMFYSMQDGSELTLYGYGSNPPSFQVSSDGTNWYNYTLGTKITLNKGKLRYFKTTASWSGITGTPNPRIYFTITGNIRAYNNVNYLCATSQPATTQITECQFYMLFAGCTGLTRAPLLPSTTLKYTSNVGQHYVAMFHNTSITETPYLPATTVPFKAYASMFDGCQYLTKVRCAATTLDVNATQVWLNGVAATGDFYCNPNTAWASGAGGIPTGWTRHGLT